MVDAGLGRGRVEDDVVVLNGGVWTSEGRGWETETLVLTLAGGLVTALVAEMKER